MTAELATPRRRCLRRPARTGNERGFTLIEVMVTLAIFSVVIALTMTQLTTSMQRTADIDRANFAAGEARIAFDALIAELRQSSSLAPGTAAITTISAQEITFFSPDGATPTRMRRISYRLRNGVLERAAVTSTNAGAAPWVFPTGAAEFAPRIPDVINTTIFDPRTGTGAWTANGAAVRQVRVKVAFASAITAAGQTSFEERVTVRVVPA